MRYDQGSGQGRANPIILYAQIQCIEMTHKPKQA